VKKYRCMVCGYVYEPGAGDPDSGVAPNTPFDELPDDWICPICGASKDQFEEI
jgi:rubredoxin